jgi:hypothetical protein
MMEGSYGLMVICFCTGKQRAVVLIGLEACALSFEGGGWLWLTAADTAHGASKVFKMVNMIVEQH